MVRAPQKSSNADVGQTRPPAILSLRRSWSGLMALTISGIVGGYVLLTRFWDQPYALRWGLGALVGVSYLLWRLWGALPQNHREGETELLGTFGTGTSLTLFRGYLTSLMAGFLVIPRPPGWLTLIPALLYSIGSLVDIFDGYFARKENRVTPMGQMLDLDFDGLAILLASILGVLYGQLPVWFLLVGVARYLFILGTSILKRRGKPVYDLTPSLMRRVMATLQMGFVSVVLFPIFVPPATTIAATLFMTPMLAGFLRDWLVVSGSINPETQAYRDVRAAAKLLLERLLPLAARVTVAAAVVWQIAVPGKIAATSISMGPFQASAALVSILSGVLAAMIVVGVLGRLAAIFLLMITSYAIGQVGLDAALFIGCVCTAVIVTYGTGPLSVWKPEDTIFRPRRNEQE